MFEKSIFTELDIKTAIQDSKNSKALGFDGICPYWLKKAECRGMRVLFNLILETGQFPKNFNRSIIRPILKDTKKSNCDMNNVRPISISNCLSQLFLR